MCSLCWVRFLLFASVSARSLSTEYITNSHESRQAVEEIQNAVCHITVSELKATANATMTRQLKGILTSSDLEKRISALEKRILSEINKITKAVLQTQSQQKFPRQDRAAEIAALNMTVQREGASALKFHYFWKIEDILSLINIDRLIESADFHFAGHHLRLCLFSPAEYEHQLFVKMVQMGEEADYALLPHELIIVNQADKTLDRVSNILYCGKTDTFYSDCAAYQLSADILQSVEFNQDDSLVIQLLIHLDY